MCLFFSYFMLFFFSFFFFKLLSCHASFFVFNPSLLSVDFILHFLFRISPSFFLFLSRFQCSFFSTFPLFLDPFLSSLSSPKQTLLKCYHHNPLTFHPTHVLFQSLITTITGILLSPPLYIFQFAHVCLS